MTLQEVYCKATGGESQTEPTSRLKKGLTHMDRILLIHPDTEARDELTSLLEDSGFQVLTAVDAAQAIAQLPRPDVIVMPEPLTKPNGDDTCMRIRQISRAPLIILGEEKQESAGIRFLEAGADAYIASPLHLDLLLAWIRRLLQRSKSNFYEKGASPV